MTTKVWAWRCRNCGAQETKLVNRKAARAGHQSHKGACIIRGHETNRLLQYGVYAESLRRTHVDLEPVPTWERERNERLDRPSLPQYKRLLGLQSSGLTQMEQRVLRALLSYADRGPDNAFLNCFPGHRSLVRSLQNTTRVRTISAVRRHLNALRRKGWITTEQMRSKRGAGFSVCLYSFTIPSHVRNVKWEGRNGGAERAGLVRRNVRPASVAPGLTDRLLQHNMLPPVFTGLPKDVTERHENPNGFHVGTYILPDVDQQRVDS